MWEKWNRHPPGVASRRATNVWIANVQFHLQKQICIQHDLLCEARRLPSLQNMTITIRQKCRIKGICIYVHSEWVPSSSSNYNQLTKCIAAIKFLILFIFSCSSPYPLSNFQQSICSILWVYLPSLLCRHNIINTIKRCLAARYVSWLFIIHLPSLLFNILFMWSLFCIHLLI